MALWLEVGKDDLTMSRFALSPLWELIHALRRLVGVSRQPGETVLRPQISYEAALSSLCTL